MTGEKKILWVTSIVIVVAVIGLMLSGTVGEKLAPEPVAAWIALQPEGASIAATESLDLPAGTSFMLHAVLEAKTVTGASVYYSEAPALEIEGRRIPAEELRDWKRPETLRILWFTVEGVSPYLELESLSGPESIIFQENYRSDWPMTWSIPGDLTPSVERLKPSDERSPVSGFGTQRFHLRIEIFGPESAIVPRHRFETPRAGEVWSAGEEFPAVTSALPGRLAGPSRLFGLTQISVPDEATTDAGASIADWTRQRLAFSRATALKELLMEAETSYPDLEWVEIELTGEVRWGGEGVLPGDLVRVGERLVILHDDRGDPDVLDYADLCFDYDKGANARALGEVFVGEGVVELARLPREASPGGDGGG